VPETLTDEETYFLQREFEDEIMESFFSKPIEGTKQAMINHIAKTAVDLFEGRIEIKERKC